MLVFNLCEVMSQRVQKVTEMVQNVTERIQQSILASLCLIFYLPHLIQACRYYIFNTFSFICQSVICLNV